MTIRLSVLLAGDTSNETGLPPSWPVNVEEIHDASIVIQYPRVEMTLLEYEQHRAAYQGAFDVWEAARDFQIHKDAMFNTLWEACHNYEFQFYSGGAYAQILELKLAGSTRAAAAGEWIFHLWSDYYVRKYAMAVASTIEAIDAVSLDFSNHANPPYTIPEMLAEASAILQQPSTP